MFDMDLQVEDINICSIENEDIVSIQDWFAAQQLLCKEKSMEISNFNKRFLEYYASECEFFLKINKNDEMLGILKGRIEFKNPNEVWFFCYLLDANKRNIGLGTKILNSVVKYFSDSYGINNFYAGVEVDDPALLRFWRNNGFEVQRVSKSFYSEEGENKSLMLLKREE